MRPSKLFALATVGIVVGMALAAPGRAQSAPTPDATFPVRGRGLVQIPPGKTIGIVLPDSSMVLFENSDSGLVVWRFNHRIETLSFYVHTLPSPLAPAILKVAKLEVIFVARNSAHSMIVGLVYGPLFPERTQHTPVHDG